MRSVVGWMGALWLVVGCTVPSDVARTCTADADCGESGRCDTTVGLCYAPGTDPELDPGMCTPACAAYEACTTAGCKPRFTALNILTPANGALLGGETVQVRAQLVANPTYAATTQYPDTIVFSVTPHSGGNTGSFGTVVRDGDTYTIPWTLPVAQARFTVTAAHPTPAAVQSGSVDVQVDTVAPTFHIDFSSPPDRISDSATHADQKDPEPGYELAFRRDEAVTVTISAGEPVSDVTLTVVGIGPGGTAGQARPPVTVQPGGACDGTSAFCGTATVDLSVPEMQAFRGSMQFRVQGQDGAGNRGEASAPLRVTRWKWAFNTGGSILGTPAVGNTGTVYVGTHAIGNGKTFAIGPEGDKKWEFPTGDVSGSPAVGALVSGVEHIYVASKTASATFLHALRGDGTKAAECTVPNTNENQSAIAVGTTTPTLGAPLETGVAIFSLGQVRIVGVRPLAGVSGSTCIEVTGTGGSALPASIPGGSLVMQDQNIFYGAAGPRITGYDLASGSNMPLQGFPQNSPSPVRGLALISNRLYGGAGAADDPSTGSLFTVPTFGGGALSFVYPQANISRVFNLSIGAGNIAYFGAETASSNELLSLMLTTTGTPSPMRAPNVGTLRGAPVLGKNDGLYTLNTQGRLSAWTATSLTSQWEVALSASDRDVSLTLDCRREANGTAVTGSGVGTLYAAADTKVYAVVVDSPGLDPNAPWPKFQHDARNTGNPATPITDCP